MLGIARGSVVVPECRRRRPCGLDLHVVWDVFFVVRSALTCDGRVACCVDVCLEAETVLCDGMATAETGTIFACNAEGCKKRFVEAAALYVHARVHGDRPYVCHYDGCIKVVSSDLDWPLGLQVVRLGLTWVGRGHVAPIRSVCI